MPRPARRAPAVAILGAVGCAISAQLRHGAFVSPFGSFGSSSPRLESPVILAASKAEIAEAEKQAKLLTWAYETAVAKGLPQAAMMKGKADQAVAALAALKEGGSAPSFSVPAAPVSSPPIAAPAPAAVAPAMAAALSGASKAEIAEAEKQAKLLTWAYETAVAKGMPQAAAAKARADQAVAKVQALKAQAQGGPAPSIPVSSPPVAVPAMTAAAPSGASKAEIAEAEKQAKLLTWAYETAVAKGMPQAAAAKARADQAVAKVQAMKAQAQGGPAPSIPVASAPVSSPPVAAPAPAYAAAAPSGASKADIAEAEKQAKLLTWAYETAVAKGMPQAAMMKAKADQAVAAVAALKAQKEMAMR